VIEKGGGIQDLAVMPFDGGDARLVVEGGGSVALPVWSPNGEHVAFMSDRGGSLDIWIVDVAGGAPRQLTSWSGFEGSPAWAHDGSGIYFTSNHDSARQNDVWRVAPAGGDPVRVTTTGGIGTIRTVPAAPGLLALTLGTRSGAIAISKLGADGRSSVVWDKSNAFIVDASASGDSVIAEVEQADGKTRSMLLKADGSGGRVILEPGQSAMAWSADGQWVLYQFAAGGRNDLGLLRLADGVTRRLTSTPESEDGAAFTHDGKRVLFRRAETEQRIMMVDLSKVIGK